MCFAKQIAQYVLEKCENDGKLITNVQLQQILYCIQCAFLKERNERCFADDFEAFGFGLCVPNVYYHYAGFGAMPITNIVLRDGKIEADDKLLIDRIVAEKSALEPWELASDCCPAVGAWRVVVDNLRDKGILLEEIKKEAQRFVYERMVLTNDRYTR